MAGGGDQSAAKKFGKIKTITVKRWFFAGYFISTSTSLEYRTQVLFLNSQMRKWRVPVGISFQVAACLEPRTSYQKARLGYSGLGRAA